MSYQIYVIRYKCVCVCVFVQKKRYNCVMLFVSRACNCGVNGGRYHVYGMGLEI